MDPATLDMDDTDFAVAILAGGKSSRMGIDKSFLKYNGLYFIQMIVDEARKVSKNVQVVIGKKSDYDFRMILSDKAEIIPDTFHLDNPMGGMLSAFEHMRGKVRYTAILACDTPFVKHKILERLYRLALFHSASLPVWENGFIEPLHAVYSVEKGYKAGLSALKEGMVGCRNLVRYMEDVVYVNVEQLRDIDPELTSFYNINSAGDYKLLHNVS